MIWRSRNWGNKYQTQNWGLFRYQLMQTERINGSIRVSIQQRCLLTWMILPWYQKSQMLKSLISQRRIAGRVVDRRLQGRVKGQSKETQVRSNWTNRLSKDVDLQSLNLERLVLKITLMWHPQPKHQKGATLKRALNPKKKNKRNQLKLNKIKYLSTLILQLHRLKKSN